MMKIYLVLPTFNNEECTLKCIDSINQNVKKKDGISINIVWVDNNSTFDSKLKVLNKFKESKNISFSRIFLAKNLGFIKAVNIGIKFSLDKNIKYIGIINNDIEVSENWLSELLNVLKENDDVMAAGSIQYNTVYGNKINDLDVLESIELRDVNKDSFEETCRLLKEKKFKNKFKAYDFKYFEDYLFNMTYVPYYSVLFKSKVFTKIGLLNENFAFGYSDDTEFNFRITKAGFKIAKCFSSLVYHKTRETFKKLYNDNFDFISVVQDGNKEQLRISKSLNKNHLKKYVIYTCISGTYDNLKTLSNFDHDNFDYVCFTDSPSILHYGSSDWKVFDLTKIKKSLNLNDEVKVARYFKTHPHLFFENYEKSIWIDANVDVIGDAIEYISLLDKNSYILIPDHPFNNDIYEEVALCKQLRKDSFENLNRMYKFLVFEKFPPKITKLVQSNIVLRDHHNKDCVFLMERWWDMIKEFSKRDQLSFNYVFWKYNGKYLSIPFDLLKLKYFTTNYKHGVTL